MNTWIQKGKVIETIYSFALTELENQWKYARKREEKGERRLIYKTNDQAKHKLKDSAINRLG